MKKDNTIYWLIGLFGILLIALLISGGYFLIPFALLGAAFYIIPEIRKRKRVEEYLAMKEKEEQESAQKAWEEKRAKEEERKQKAAAAAAILNKSSQDPAREVEQKEREAEKEKREDEQKKREAEREKKEAERKQKETEREKREAERKLKEERREAEAEEFVGGLHLTWGDLRIKGAENRVKPFDLTDRQLAYYTEIFFRGKNALSPEGSALSREERFQVIHSVFLYAGFWSCRPSRYEPQNISCKPGEIVITYFETEVEVPCYDGGNCGTDFEKRVLRLRCQWIDMDPAAWQAKEELWKKGIVRRYARTSMSRADFAEEWIRDWGYETELGSESAPVIIPDGGYGTLHLWNPFGLKGVLVFHHDLW